MQPTSRWCWGRTCSPTTGRSTTTRRLRAALPGPLALHRRHRGTAASSGAPRQSLPRADRGDVRLRELGRRRSTAAAGARPARHQAAVLPAAAGRHSLRLGTQGAVGARQAADRSRAPCAISCFTATFRRRRRFIAASAKLPAGHTLTWEDGRVRSSDIGTPSAERRGRAPADDAWNMLDELLRTVVPAHMLSDVPVGVFLSGGIDSALTTYYLDASAHLQSGFRRARPIGTRGRPQRRRAFPHRAHRNDGAGGGLRAGAR